MASLNTLRTKGGILVSIVIGLALVAFLMTDLTSSGSRIFGNRQMRLGEINGEPIEYQEYAAEAQHMARLMQIMSGVESLAADQTDRANDMAWEAMITRKAVQPGFDDLGVWVGQAEQADMVNGTYISSVLTSMFSDPSTGIYEPAALQMFLTQKNTDPTGNASLWWEYVKEQMYNQRMMSKYAALISNGMFANNLDVEEGVKAANSSFDARYVSLSYSTIADSTITISDSQVRKFYDQHKESFKQGESRTVEYVLFDMSPSADDYAQAEKQVSEIATEFAVAQDAIQYASANSHNTVDQRYVSPSTIDPAILAAVSGGGMYGPVLSGDTYTMARLASTRNVPDSVGVRQIMLMPGQETLADSLVQAIKGGADFGALVAQYSLDQQTPGGDMGVFAPENIMPEIAEACFKANKGDAFTLTTGYGLHVMQLTHKSASTQKMQIATITYQVEPSSLTEQNVYGQASSFMTAIAGKGKFDKAADEANLTKRTVTISNSDRDVNGLQNSRSIVRWAFTAKAGDVTKDIMEVNGNYVIATLTGVSHQGVAPLKQVEAGIRAKLMRDEKVRLLGEKMQGSSVDAIASNFGAEVLNAEGLQRGAFFVDGGAGVEPKLIGAICNSTQGTVSKPVEGYGGVYVFEVTSVATADNATVESEKVRLESMSQSYIMQRVASAIAEECNILDMRVKFF